MAEPAITAAEFERLYAERSGLTVDELREHGRVVVRCRCGGTGCQGWASVSREAARDYEPGGIYGPPAEDVSTAALRRTAEAQRHSSGDAHGVSVKPSRLLALLDVVDAAASCVVVTEDEDGTKWVSGSPAGFPALEKALRVLEPGGRASS